MNCELVTLANIYIKSVIHVKGNFYVSTVVSLVLLMLIGIMAIDQADNLPFKEGDIFY